MEPNRSGFAPEKQADNDNRKSRMSDSSPSMTVTKPRQPTWGERWNDVQLSKTAVFWVCLGAMMLTMLVGFRWGGWVTGGSAEQTAKTMSNNAVITRLATICVAQFQLDPTKTEKLVELKAIKSYEQSTYVGKQTWAVMPGEEKADNKVASECSKLLIALN